MLSNDSALREITEKCDGSHDDSIVIGADCIATG